MIFRIFCALAVLIFLFFVLVAFAINHWAPIRFGFWVAMGTVALGGLLQLPFTVGKL